MRRAVLFAAGLGLAFVGGCGTMINVQNAAHQKPYGGFTMPIDDFFGGANSEAAALLYWPLWLGDKPLSLFGDTLTLPYTLWAQRATWLPVKPRDPDRDRDGPYAPRTIKISASRDG